MSKAITIKQLKDFLNSLTSTQDELPVFESYDGDLYEMQYLPEVRSLLMKPDKNGKCLIWDEEHCTDNVKKQANYKMNGLVF